MFVIAGWRKAAFLLPLSPTTVAENSAANRETSTYIAGGFGSFPGRKLEASTNF